MKICAAYIRVSTEDQTEYSPDSQLKIIQAYAKKNDMIVPEEFVFVDEGISGRTAEKRPSFMRMIGMAKVKPKQFDAILVYALSRFARSREDSVVYKRMLRNDCNIDVISVTQDFGNDKTSILIEALLEAMDEYYSIDLSENVKRGMTEKVKRGQVVTAPPFGYNIENNVFIVDEINANIVKDMYNDFLNNDMGYREIAEKLNSLNIKTKRGNKWENRTVEYILRNPVYTGKLRWNPVEQTDRNYDHPDIIIVDGEHEPIISDEVFEKTQEKILRRKKMYGKYEKKRHPKAMLQGLVKCSNCGKTLSRSSNGYFQCIGYSHGQCSISHYISENKLNNAVIDYFNNAFVTSDFILIQKSNPVKNDLSRIALAQIKKEQAKLKRIKEAYEAGVYTLEEYRISKQNVENTIATIKASIEDDEESMESKKKKFREKYKNASKILMESKTSDADKNKFLRTFVDRIVYEKSTGNIKLFFYS